MLDGPVIDDHVIAALGCLAQSCHDAAASPVDLAERYAALRAKAMDLNDRYGWATADEFATQIPSLEGLVAIESLDRALGEMSSPEPSAEEETPARLTEALVQLAGWLTGVRLACETLRDMRSGA